MFIQAHDSRRLGSMIIMAGNISADRQAWCWNSSWKLISNPQAGGREKGTNWEWCGLLKPTVLPTGKQSFTHNEPLSLNLPHAFYRTCLNELFFAHRLEPRKYLTFCSIGNARAWLIIPYGWKALCVRKWKIWSRKRTHNSILCEVLGRTSEKAGTRMSFWGTCPSPVLKRPCLKLS